MLAELRDFTAKLLEEGWSSIPRLHGEIWEGEAYIPIIVAHPSNAEDNSFCLRVLLPVALALTYHSLFRALPK